MIILQIIASMTMNVIIIMEDVHTTVLILMEVITVIVRMVIGCMITRLAVISMSVKKIVITVLGYMKIVQILLEVMNVTVCQDTDTTDQSMGFVKILMNVICQETEAALNIATTLREVTIVHVMLDII
jgi:hypothetical protein